MGRYFGFRELYPKYPVQLATRRDSKIRLGTRQLYVDVPFPIYHHYIRWWMYHEGIGDKQENLDVIQRIKDDLNKELGDRYSSIYSVEGPIERGTGKPFIRLRIRWDKLIDYLEWRARDWVEDVKRVSVNHVGSIIRDLYVNDIICNYIGLLLLVNIERALDLLLSKTFNMGLDEEVQRYRKLLSRLGEIDHIEELVERLRRAIEKIYRSERRRLAGLQKDVVSMDKLIISNLTLNINDIVSAVYDVNIGYAYLNMRRSIETLVRLLCFYRTLGNRSLCPAGRRSRRETEIEIEYCFSNENDEDILFKAFAHSAKNLYGIGISLNIQNLQKLGVEPRHAEDLKRIYSIASEVIHRIPRLPFYSLLEFKVFKHVFRWYVETVESIAGTATVSEEVEHDVWGRLELEQHAVHEAVRIVRDNKRDVIEAFKEVVRGLDERDLEYLRLAAYLSPSRATLEKGLLLEEEFLEALEKASRQLGSPASLILSLAADRLKTVSIFMGEKLVEKGIIASGDPDYAAKVAFYTLLLALGEGILF
ncbi:hypothetical protein [Aeropyrum pernix]|uniref:hypothetical protein n=1 Tax=Aeropyrum pernix TaxID=56636 RepID=UPI000005DE64|nr:hypothetical protein [Aeropyrum pernix]